MKHLWVILLLVGCGQSIYNQDERVKRIEEELVIRLPFKYDVIRDEDISHEWLSSDFTSIMELELNEVGYKTVLDQLIETPFYDSLSRFYNDGGGVVLMNEQIQEYKEIQDSILKTDYRGVWSNRDSAIVFIDFKKGEYSDAIDSYLHKKKRVLYFEFIKI